MNPRLTTLSLGATILLAGSLLAACGGSGTAVAHSAATPAAGPRDAALLFEGACATCHGRAGEGGLSGVRLRGATVADRSRTADEIRDGVGAMPPAPDDMTDREIQELADYVAGLR
jgi:mono/diheme cytochrome c family protein